MYYSWNPVFLFVSQILCKQKCFFDNQKDLLGHKSLMSADRYQHGNYTSDEYIIKRPRTSQEEDALGSTGFKFVRFDHGENVPIYRKRK